MLLSRWCYKNTEERRSCLLDPLGSLVSTLLVVGCGLWVGNVTLFQNLFILSVVMMECYSVIVLVC